MCNSIVDYEFALLICEHDYDISLLGYISAVKLCYWYVYHIILFARCQVCVKLNNSLVYHTILGK